MHKGRVEAFSDGVIAIAITLLVLDVHVPPKGTRSLLQELGSQWPSYGAYIVSFIAIGVMWVNHHALFDDVRKVDRPLLFLNLLLLMGIAFLPFPTALFAAYLTHPPHHYDANVAAATYSATMVLISIAFTAIRWWMVRDDRLLQTHVDRVVARKQLWRFSLGLWIYLGTVGVALVNAVACLLVHFVIVGYYAVDQLSTSEAAELS